jgi:biopolymer transport protein ExbD
MLYRRKNRSELTVDLSPLIDVVFLLLIFFMVSTRFKEDHGLDLDLPQAESRQSSETERLTLFIGRDGEIKLKDAAVNKDQLPDMLRQALAESEDKMVVLHVDKDVNHGLVVEIMDTAKEAGASGLTFAAKSKRP